MHLIVELNLWKDIDVKKILENGLKELNIYIADNENNNSIDRINSNDDSKNEFIEMVINSYYNKLLSTKKELTVDWEKFCAKNDIMNIMKTMKKNLVIV